MSYTIKDTVNMVYWLTDFMKLQMWRFTYSKIGLFHSVCGGLVLVHFVSCWQCKNIYWISHCRVEIHGNKICSNHCIHLSYFSCLSKLLSERVYPPSTLDSDGMRSLFDIVNDICDIGTDFGPWLSMGLPFPISLGHTTGIIFWMQEVRNVKLEMQNTVFNIWGIKLWFSIVWSHDE